LSTIEVEFIAITEACKELLWMKKFGQELGSQQQRYVLLAKILLFIVDLNILMCGIIESMIFWILKY